MLKFNNLLEQSSAQIQGGLLKKSQQLEAVREHRPSLAEADH